VKAHQFLTEIEAPQKEEFQASCQKKFILSTYFNGSDCNNHINISLSEREGDKEQEN